MYWGWNFDRNQTWWNLGAGTGAYWARCHWMLQEGRTVYDACAWSPNESFYAAVWRATNPWKSGGNDVAHLGNDVFMGRGAVDAEGYFTTGPGLRYRVLIGVWNQVMSVAELRKLKELIEGGIVFVGGAPQSPKGLNADEAAFRELVGAIWGRIDPVNGKALGKGHVYDGPVWNWTPERSSEYLQGILKRYILPDFEVPGEPIRSERQGFTFQHRRSADAEWYFVSNQKPEAKRADCIFRVAGKHPELWNPVTGTIETLDVFTVLEDGRIRVPLAFDRDGACFVVFRKPLDTSRQIVLVDGETASTRIADGALRSFADGRWELTRADGSKRSVEIKGLPKPVVIGGPWQLSFQPHRGAPASARLDQLQSLSEHADESIRYFSGEVLYRTRFTLPAPVSTDGRRLHLDLDKVAVIAEVTLNGKAFTPLWTAPFRLDVTEALKQGENILDIRVANTWINRFIGDLRLPEENRAIDYNQPNGKTKGLPKEVPAMWAMLSVSLIKKNLNADTPLPTSGLIGPVRLVAEQVVRP